MGCSKKTQILSAARRDVFAFFTIRTWTSSVVRIVSPTIRDLQQAISGKYEMSISIHFLMTRLSPILNRSLHGGLWAFFVISLVFECECASVCATQVRLACLCCHLCCTFAATFAPSNHPLPWLLLLLLLLPSTPCLCQRCNLVSFCTVAPAPQPTFAL